MATAYGDFEPMFRYDVEDITDIKTTTLVPADDIDVSPSLSADNTMASSQAFPPPTPCTSPAASDDEDSTKSAPAAYASHLSASIAARSSDRDHRARNLPEFIQLPSLPALLSPRATHFPFGTTDAIAHAATTNNAPLPPPFLLGRLELPTSSTDPLTPRAVPSPGYPLPGRNPEVYPAITRLLGLRARLPPLVDGALPTSDEDILREAEHALVHCDQCALSFASTLDAEMHVHHGGTFYPYLCTGGCRLVFTHKRDHQEHWDSAPECREMHEEMLILMSKI